MKQDIIGFGFVLITIILDRIYRIFRIHLSVPGFPEESQETQTAFSGKAIGASLNRSKKNIVPTFTTIEIVFNN
jgi:hypothetical protein